ncbi:MAG: hypothetical protein SF069_07395, partial [Phycisphaerae bacterium]|nr:hypothetical protein [Phycisphaerae bacterium]
MAGTTLSDGRRAYVWTEAPTAGGGDLHDVYAEIRFANSATGTDDVARFLVGGGAGNQYDVAIAANASSGGFAIAYQDRSVADGQLTVKFYSVAGVLLTTVAQANVSVGLNDESFPKREVSIVGLSNGNYLVAWSDGATDNVFGRVYTSNGFAATGQVTLVTGTGYTSLPALTALADGRFVAVVWDNATIKGRIFNNDGTVSSPEFEMTSAADFNDGIEPSIAALQDGRFVVVWKSGGDIRGQVMFADGTKDGAEFVANTDTTGTQQDATVAALADGRFVVSWTDKSTGTDRVMATIFDPRETNINQSGSSFGDDAYGTSFNDAYYAGAGNDTVRGQGGSDYILGEAGNDSLLGGDATDLLYG